MSFRGGGYDPLMVNKKRSEKRRLLSFDEIAQYDHVADGLLGRVKVIQSRFLPNGADGVTIGKFIFVKPGHFDRPISKLMAHELVHVRQFAELGGITFVSKYVAEYFTHLWKLRSHREAYLAISFEVEAREVAEKWHRAQQNQQP